MTSVFEKFEISVYLSCYMCEAVATFGSDYGSTFFKIYFQNIDGIYLAWLGLMFTYTCVTTWQIAFVHHLIGHLLICIALNSLSVQKLNAHKSSDVFEIGSSKYQNVDENLHQLYTMK